MMIRVGNAGSTFCKFCLIVVVDLIYSRRQMYFARSYTFLKVRITTKYVTPTVGRSDKFCRFIYISNPE